MPNLLIKFIGHRKEDEAFASFAVFRVWKEENIEVLRETKVPVGTVSKEQAEVDALLMALERTFTGLNQAGMQVGQFSVHINHDDKPLCDYLNSKGKRPLEGVKVSKKVLEILDKFNMVFTHWEPRKSDTN